jgi:hypothetical protein
MMRLVDHHVCVLQNHQRTHIDFYVLHLQLQLFPFLDKPVSGLGLPTTYSSMSISWIFEIENKEVNSTPLVCIISSFTLSMLASNCSTSFSMFS